MNSETHAFGGGIVESAMNPAVMVALIIAMLMILVLPRKYVIIPFLLSIFLIPLGQQLYLAGVHWLSVRLIVMAGLARVAAMKATSKTGLFTGGVTPIDRTFMLCVCCEVCAFMLLYMNQDAAVNQFGHLIDFLGGYLVIRAFLEDENTTYRALKWMAFLTVVLAAGMVWEQMTLQNVFGLMGGTRAVSEVREGKIRSQGVFQHSLTAGTFGATLLPLFYLLWRTGKARLAAVAGAVGCTVMTICSNSSTPLLAYAAGIFGVCLWPLRKNMKRVRWALVLSIVALNFVMKAPVWFIIAHIDLTGSSSGYHRAALVDLFIRHFSDWWLIGVKELDAANWAPDMWDQQNEYVSVGEAGGLAAFSLFISMFCYLYSRLGKARRLAEGTESEWTVWLLGAALFAHMLGFFGVNYFDQSKMSWFMLLAIIPALTQPILQNQTQPKSEIASEPSTERYEFPLPECTRIDFRQIDLHDRRRIRT